MLLLFFILFNKLLGEIAQRRFCPCLSDEIQQFESRGGHSFLPGFEQDFQSIIQNLFLF